MRVLVRAISSLQARLDPADLQLSQLKAIALRNMCGQLHLYLPDLIKLPQLEYLEVQSTTRPPRDYADRLAIDTNLRGDEAVNLSRPFMLTISRNKGMPDTRWALRANADSIAWYATQQRQRDAAVECLERVFGPQDRHELAHGLNRMSQYIPMRRQDLDMEIVYCNAPSRKLAHQLITDCSAEKTSGWARRRVKCTQTISKCRSCHEYEMQAPHRVILVS